jgi:hypothetical protein
MDTIDQASLSQEAFEERMIQAVRKKAGHTLLFTGKCYYCSENIKSPHIFCDVSCRNDYEREERLNAISGRR